MKNLVSVFQQFARSNKENKKIIILHYKFQKEKQMNSKSRFLVLAVMILAAAFTRLIPHPPNFTAVGAIALFGGAYFTDKKLAFIIPFITMIITDSIIGFHSTVWAVYLSFALIVLIGFGLMDKKKISNIFLASVSASVLFFVITNFAVWLNGTMYPLNPAGLLACYVAAIPFFHYNLLGDLFYVGIMFGAFELARHKFPQLIVQ